MTPKSLLIYTLVLVDCGENFTKKELPLSGHYMSDYHKSREVLLLCDDTTYWTGCSLKPLIHFRASDLCCIFDYWALFTNTFTLFTPLNHMITFFISLLFSYFPDFISSRRQIYHLFNQIYVAHNIKNIYFIALFASLEGFSSIEEWIT